MADKSYDLNEFKKILLVGAGKATARMALALEQLLGGRIDAGLIIVKYGHLENLMHIQQIEAAHPVPDQAGVEGTQRILDMLQQADEQTLVLCLLSGGASALLLAPAAGLLLEDKQQVTHLLLRAGASISELNTLRKHLSAIKGGGLARAAFPATVVSLILSDVLGDPLDVIASGPTAADHTTYQDAWDVLQKYRLIEKLPARVERHLRDGMLGGLQETVKAGDVCLGRVHNVIIGNLEVALQAAQDKAQQSGLRAEITNRSVQGLAGEAALALAAIARDTLGKMQPQEKRCLLSGGETTVNVTGSGEGGRNQQLALAFALAIEGLPGVTLLSAATDGGDGANDAAGAMVNGNTARHARKLKLSSPALSATRAPTISAQVANTSVRHTS